MGYFEMNAKISEEIQAEQDHGRTKYGRGPDDFAYDDLNSATDWHNYIDDHNARARIATPLERRQHLIKLAGLAVSEIESIDRKRMQSSPLPTKP